MATKTEKPIKNRTTFFGALLCGGVLGAATFAPFLWVMVPLAFAGLLYLIATSSKKSSFFVGWAAGAGIAGASFLWFFTTLPLTWLGIDSFAQGFLMVLVVWSACTMFVALATGLWALAMAHIRESLLWLLVAPVAWVFSEMVRALLFSVATWGEGSLLYPEVTFGNIGYALAWADGYLWLARFGGVYVLSFFAALCGTMVYLAVRDAQISKRRTKFFIFVLALGVFVAGGALLPSPVVEVIDPEVVSVGGLRIAPVRTRIEPSLGYSPLEWRAKQEYLQEHILAAAAHSPDIIVLPEYALYFRGERYNDPILADEVLAVLKEKGIALIDSGRTSAEEGRYGEILFFDGSSGQIMERHHKRLLIPFGEYVPYLFAQGLSLFGMREEVEAMKNVRSYARSREPFSERIFEHKGARLGVLACSEIFAPFGYKKLADAGADVFINVASHSWARDSAPLLFNQTYAMALVHVAYARKPYVQATNYAPSYALFPRSFKNSTP